MRLAKHGSVGKTSSYWRFVVITDALVTLMLGRCREAAEVFEGEVRTKTDVSMPHLSVCTKHVHHTVSFTLVSLNMMMASPSVD
jgi:hypothetical protein